jgi:hypothetical protein
LYRPPSVESRKAAESPYDRCRYWVARVQDTTLTSWGSSSVMLFSVRTWFSSREA